jgi:uncharacterized membrane protein HdeD (DUF308 family)
MNKGFWKEHVQLRMILIALFAVLGIAFTITGWKMTGQLNGLGIMIVGVVCLLVALWIYNKPFEG